MNTAIYLIVRSVHQDAISTAIENVPEPLITANRIENITASTITPEYETTEVLRIGKYVAVYGELRADKMYRVVIVQSINAQLLDIFDVETLRHFASRHVADCGYGIYVYKFATLTAAKMFARRLQELEKQIEAALQSEDASRAEELDLEVLELLNKYCVYKRVRYADNVEEDSKLTEDEVKMLGIDKLVRRFEEAEEY